ncbi:hypothetical protein B0J15DRAFT_464493 [Fusarium solani]|uniref:Uncharacterized protein n=1 Tax=Fusarium solani TaxID=169388 RepID=A0A9P9HWE3_FUSSL|nr:uncharacterized protein B0J15DRAFT_464493 [Fusarium solani]KAH7264616.1 hypothetical protein B0J15DRAFT_464493 [Fusarium solani]
MAPESFREKDTRHHALPKRRLSTHVQEPDDHESKRARIGDYSAQSQPTFSTNSAPSTSPFYVGQVEATTPFNENIDDASEGNKQWGETGQYFSPNAAALTVVERATVLCKPSAFSSQRQLSVLDISFNSTCQTNFCARIEGFNNMWVAKLSCIDLCDELIFNVWGEDETQDIYGIMVGEGWSSKIMGIHWGGTRFTSDDGDAVHFIIWSHSCSMDIPTRLLNLEEEAGCREFVEMIGGCWVE